MEGLIKHQESDILAPSERVSESELFFRHSDGSLELKRNVFRAIEVILPVYQDSPSEEPAVLYKRLYPWYISFQEKGGIRFEDGSLPPETIEKEREITDLDLLILEQDVATLWVLNLNMTAKILDISAGREFRPRSVFGGGSCNKSGE